MLPPNFRDLGDLPLVGGGATTPRRLYRSGMDPEATPEVWTGLTDLGVRSVVDLRNADERRGAGAPSGMRVRAVPLERPDDPEYSTTWGSRWAEPGFFVWAMGRWPELWESALRAVAEAPSEALLIHCAAGRDRTGFMVAMLLDAVGVTREAILDDYRRGIRDSASRNLDDLADECAVELDEILDRPLPEPWPGRFAQAAQRLR